MANSFTRKYLENRKKRLGAAESAAPQTRQGETPKSSVAAASASDFTARYLAARKKTRRENGADGGDAYAASAADDDHLAGCADIPLC